MRGLNQVQLIGNLGADPEVRNTAAGTTVAKFVEWFPDVSERQVRAVLEHEAAQLRTDLAR